MLAYGATPAWASNGSKLRTPVVFQDQPCLEVIDQGAAPPIEIQFSVPMEDLDLTEDELPDSRTARLYAVCADYDLGTDLPNWIDLSDAERALTIGNIDELPPDAEVLESSDEWPLGTCVFPILGTDQAVPLSCEGTEAPASWDADGVPAGTYAIRGYTFEPAINLWSRRLGVVVVRAPGEPLPAAAALMSPSRTAKAYAEAGYQVRGCAVGPVGSTLELQWAAVTSPDTWTTFHSGDAASSADEADFLVEFSPPPAAENQAVWLRAIVTPPEGAGWTGYAIEPLLVNPGDGESDPPDVVESFDICGVGDDGGTDGGEDGGSETDEGGDSGGGCRVTSTQPGPLALLFVLLLTRRRRSAAR